MYPENVSAAHCSFPLDLMSEVFVFVPPNLEFAI